MGNRDLADVVPDEKGESNMKERNSVIFLILCGVNFLLPKWFWNELTTYI